MRRHLHLHSLPILSVGRFVWFSLTDEELECALLVGFLHLDAVFLSGKDREIVLEHVDYFACPVLESLDVRLREVGNLCLRRNHRHKRKEDGENDLLHIDLVFMVYNSFYELMS